MLKMQYIITLFQKAKKWVIGSIQYACDRKEYMEKSKASGNGGFPLTRRYCYPVLYDRYDTCCALDGHYFMQDIYMAQEIRKSNPKEHYDIGSRVDGFIAHLIVFRDNVTIVDIRPLPFRIPGVKFLLGDATDLECIDSGTIESISSLHAVEHFGLGRYGDSVDPLAWKKVLNAMCRVLRGGAHCTFPFRLEIRTGYILMPIECLNLTRSQIC